MTTRDSSTAATLAFQAEIASAKARRDRDQPRHSTLPADPSPAPESNPSEPGSDTPDLGGKAA